VNVVVLSVGRPRDTRLVELHDDYAARLRRFRIGYEARFVAEVRAGTRYTDQHVREREGRALLAALPAGAFLVALDPSGEVLDSGTFARRLERWAAGTVAFVVGGPLGLDAAVLARAGAVWSLSRATFPHELTRVLVAEQIYRALTILRGLPYHK